MIKRRYFSCLNAFELEKRGFPKVSVHCRCVFFLLATGARGSRYSVSEVARAVWGKKNYRNCARNTLKQLQEAGLVRSDEDGWYSLLAINDFINCQREERNSQRSLESLCRQVGEDTNHQR